MELRKWLIDLKRLQAVFPQAVIAGGALRDRLLVVPYKDVDFFVYAGPDISDLQGALQRAWPDRVVVDQIELRYDNDDREIVDIYLSEEYNIIFMSKPFTLQSLVHDFDIGLTMLGTDGEELYVDPRFWTDLRQKTFTVHRLSTLERSVARATRWKERYPDFELVVPHAA